MASKPHPKISDTFRFEFDPVNKIMAIRFKGRVTNESLESSYRAAQKFATLTDASASIMDCSLVTEFDVSTELIRQLANQEPVLSDPKRPRFIVASKTLVFGLARMFQIMGEHSRPHLRVVRTMDEALEALGVQNPHFEPLGDGDAGSPAPHKAHSSSSSSSMP
jgi:hypothetical protein